MSVTHSVEGKVIAITGGAQGIGLATAKMLVSKGAKVSIGDLDEDALKKAEEEIKSLGKGEQVRVQQLNVADSSSVTKWIENTVDWAGQKLDGACNVAGTTGKWKTDNTLMTTPDEQWNMIVAVNFTGMFNSLRAELNNIKDGGSIVCVSSVQGTIGFANSATYSATKHGVLGLMKSAAKENGHRNVRVNAITPGAIDTQMVAAPDRENPLTPLKRIGKPEECAAMMVFLLSDDAGFTTGAQYAIDGGWNC